MHPSPNVWQVPEAALPAPSVEVEEEDVGFSQYTEVQPAEAPLVDGKARSLVLALLSVLPLSNTKSPKTLAVN